MNWLFIAVLIFMVVMIVSGYRKGFVKIAYSLLSLILALVLVSVFAPYVQEALIERTPIYDKMVEKCSGQIQAAVESQQTGESQTVQGILDSSGIRLPGALEKVLDRVAIDDETKENVYMKAGSVMAKWLVYVFGFVIAFIVIMLCLRFVGNLLDLVTKLPILRGTNKLLGGAAGFLQGILFLWIGGLVLSLICTTTVGRYLIAMVYESEWLRMIYDHNGIIYLAVLFL